MSGFLQSQKESDSQEASYLKWLLVEARRSVSHCSTIRIDRG